MSVVKELIRTEENGKISFGNYELAAKSKLSDFEHDGDMYKVRHIMKLQSWSATACSCMNLFRELQFWILM